MEELDRVRLGDIPWTAEGYFEVLSHRSVLESGPNGGQDGSRCRIAFVLENDQSERLLWFTPSPSATSGQLGFFMAEWFRRASLDRTTSMSHMRRYSHMNLFLSQHRQRLIEDEVATVNDEDPKQVVVAAALVDVLATSPYDGQVRNPHSGEIEPSFDYETVVRATKLRMAEDG